MASNGRITYEIGFTTNEQQLMNAIRTAQTALNSISNMSNNPAGLITAEMQQASLAATQLSNTLKIAFNQATHSLDLSKFQDTLNASGVSLQQLATRLAAIGPQGQEAFLKVSQAIQSAELPVSRLSLGMTKLLTTMKNTMRWQLSSMMIRGFMNAIQTCYGYAQDLNKSLNNIRIVTGHSADEMARFSKEANNVAKRLSTTTTDVTDAALIYYQQGLNDEQVKERYETTIKLSNVSRQSAEEVSSQLTAIWNNFDDGTKKLEYYADAITALGATTAASSAEIAGGIEKFSAIAKTVGLSYEYAASALATIVAATRQSEETVGTGLRTILGRIESLNMGETLEDDVTLTKYTKALRAAGVEVLDQNKQLKSANEILEGIAEKWQIMTSTQKESLAYTVGGVRQYATLIALMDNWDKFQANVQTATNSEGTLEKQQETYAEGWEAARNRVTTAAEDIYDSLINPDSFISLSNSLADVLGVLDNLIDGFNGLGGIIQFIGVILLNAFGSKVAAAIDNVAYGTRRLLGIEQARAQAIKNATAEMLENISEGKISTENEAEQVGQINQLYRDLEARKREISEITYKTLQDEIKQLEVQRQLNIEAAKEAENAQNTAMSKEANLKNGLHYQSRMDLTTQSNNGTAFLNSHGAALTRATTRAQQEADIAGLSRAVDAKGNYIDPLRRAASNVAYETTRYGRFYTDKRIADYNELRYKSGNLSGYEEKLNALQSAHEFNSQEVQNVIKQINDNTGIEIHAQSFEEAKKAIQQVHEAYSNYADSLEGPIAAACNKNVSEVQEMGTAQEKYGKQLVISEENNKSFGKQVKKTGQDIVSAEKAVQSFSQRLVMIGQTLMSVSMAMNGLQSLKDIWSQEDLSEGERLTQSISALAMVALSLGQIMQSNIITSTVSKIQSKLLSIEKYKESAAWQAAAGSALTYQLIAGAVVVAIGALVAGVIWLCNSLSNQESELERINKALESVTTAYSNLSEEIKKFQDLASKYDGAIEALKQLEDGTEAYRAKLEEANELAKEIIERNKELAGSAYVDSNGVITFERDVFEQYQNDQERYQRNLDITKNRLEQQKIAETYNNDITYFKERLSEAGVDYSTAGFNYYDENKIKSIIDYLDEHNFTEVTEDILRQIPALANASDAMIQAILAFKDNLIADLINERHQMVGTTSFYNQQNIGLGLTGNELYDNEGSQFKSALTAVLDDEFKNRFESKDYQYRIEEKYKNKDENGRYGEYGWALEWARDNGYRANIDSIEESKTGYTFYHSKEDKDKGENGVTISNTQLSNYLVEREIFKEFNSDSYVQPYLDSLHTIYDTAEQLGEGLGKEALEFIKKRDLEIADLANKTPSYVINALKNSESVFKDLGFNDTVWQRYGWESGEAFTEAWEDALLDYDPVNWLNNQISKVEEAYNTLGDTLDLMRKDKLGKKEAKELSEELLNVQQIIQSLDPNFSAFSGIDNLQDLSTFDQAKVIGQVRQVLAANKDGLIEQYKKETEELLKEQEKILKNRQIGKDGSLIDLSEKDNDRLKKIKERLEELNHFKITLDFDADMAAVDRVAAEISQVNKAASLIQEGYKVKLKDVEELASILPEVFDNATEHIKEGYIQLSKDTIDWITQQMDDEVTFVRETSVARLQARADAAQKELDIIQGLETAVVGSNAQSVKDIINNEKISRDEQKVIAQTILQSKISKKIQEMQASAQTASNEIQNQNQVVNEAAKGSAIMENNYREMYKKINLMGWETYNNLHQYEVDYTTGNNVASRAMTAAVMVPVTYSRHDGQLSTDYEKVAPQFKELQQYLKNFNLKDIDDKPKDNSEYWVDATTGEIHWDGEGSGAISKAVIDQLEMLGYEGFTNRDLSSTGNFLDKFFNSYGDDKASFMADLAEGKNDKYKELADYFATIAGLDTNGLEDAGKGKNKTKEKKEKPKEARYKNIESEISSLENAYKDIEDQMDRTFGVERIAKYSDAISNLTQRAEALGRESEEAAGYITKDQADLVKTLQDAGVEIQELEYDKATGQIKNYEEIFKAIETKRQEAFSADQTDNLYRFDYAFEALDKTVDSVNKFIDTKRKQAELYIEAQRKALEQIMETFDRKMDFQNARKKIRDFVKDVTESRGTILDWGATSMQLGVADMNEELWTLQNIADTYQELQNKRANADKNFDMKQWAEDIQKLQDQLLASGKDILQWIDEIENMVPNAISEAATQFGRLTSSMDTNIKSAQNIQKMYEILGKSGAISLDELFEGTQAALGAAGDAQFALAQMYKNTRDSIRPLYDAAVEAFNNAAVGTTEHDRLQKEVDAYLAQLNAAEDGMQQQAQAALASFEQMLINNINEAVRKINQELANGYGDLDWLEESLDRKLEIEEEYLDAVNREYAISKLNRQLQDNIDKTTTAAATARLKALQEEFDLRQQNNELSQYDIDIMQKKLDMTLKQIALEDAQNAKTDLRLVRNAQGNWTYQYTANQEDINKAQQEYDDAANEWYNLAKDKVTDTSKLILQKTKELTAKLKEIGEDQNLTEEERLERMKQAQADYLTEVQYLEGEKTKAVKDMTEAGSIAIEGFQNTYAEELGKMAANTTTLKQDSDTLIGEIMVYWSEYGTKVGEVTEALDLSINGEGGEGGLKKDLADVATNTSEIASAADILTPKIWDEVGAMDKWATAAGDVATSLQSILDKISDDAWQQLNNIYPEYPNAGMLSDKQWDKLKEKDISKIMARYIAAGGDTSTTEFQDMMKQRDLKKAEANRRHDLLGYESIEQMNERYLGSADFIKTIGAETTDVVAQQAALNEYRKWLDEYQRIVKADTGMYTGDFEGGKLAVLHQKELVLNASDTSNILQAVEFTRNFWQNIGKELDMNALAGIGLMLTKLRDVTGSVGANESILQQEVTIHADFPNVQDSREIEIALNNLINDASQYVNK